MPEPPRPEGIEIATLTPYDVPTLAILSLEAYGEPLTAEAIMESSEELRLTFEGAFGATTEDSFVGAWDGGTLVGAILVVRESPWDDPPDGPFVVDLMVAPEYRRRGIATALVAEAARRGHTGRSAQGAHAQELWAAPRGDARLQTSRAPRRRMVMRQPDPRISD